VLQFAISGLLAMLVIGLIVVGVSRTLGTRAAISDAKQAARLAGMGIVEPYVDDSLLRGDPGARARLDQVVKQRVLRHGIVRVKIWTADGKIIYSDEPRIVGRRFGLEDGELDALRRGVPAEAEVSDLGRPENRYERPEHKLLEVYLPIHTPSGVPLLFESYQRFSSVLAGGQHLWLTFAPALVGGLLLLQLVNLPLAASLARRLRRGQAEREALLQRALDASETERRLIAASLHDGVVQDLVGVSYALAAQAERLDHRGERGAGAALQQGAAQTRDSVRALRALLVDIYPPTLHRAGLAAALRDLGTSTRFRRLAVSVDVPDDLDLAEPTERLLFRAGQEALRNVQRHADAAAAWLELRAEGERVVLVVRDDGGGFDPAILDARARQGHLGLRALGDLVRDAGGRLDIVSVPGAGSTMRVEVPR